MKWKPDWPKAQKNFVEWWNGDGLVLMMAAPREEPREGLQPPEDPEDLETQWLDPEYRLKKELHRMASTHYVAEAFPSFNALIGPGSLGTFIGAEPVLEPTTVWYKPCIDDPESYGEIAFDPEDNKWLDAHVALIDIGLEHAEGRYLVGMPDLIENIDTLAAMRGNEKLLMDLVERPEWVKEKVWEINRAFFEAFDYLYEWIKDEQGGNVFQAFGLWGPGKTCKVQCDFCCMISRAMFDDFVVPALAEQCEWLDYSMYHLDGTGAMHHLDSLLDIEALDAIEWTPEAGLPKGGDPRWYDLYRRIKEGGKGVQAIGVAADEVVPLIEAVGPEGLFICTGAETPQEAEAVAKAVEQYR